MIRSEAKVMLVGAGPGDPELISVKGLKAVAQADVLLYDALVAPALLEQVKPGCRLVYVGKRRGHKAFEQEEINALLLFYAQRHVRVVRLKGGDPFVFGRGHEELMYLQQHGVTAEVIPGISSALAAPAAAGIPLTKRHVNESFWVVTGVLSDGSLAGDLHHAAQSTATVIILMGMAQLPEIVRLFSQARSPLEPIAVIQNATCADQQIAISMLCNITETVQQQGLTSPAVMVIGKVVDEHTLTHALAFQKDPYLVKRS
ncbi:uroporphyrinogen-III C-methyltransferase [Parachryseolinea silvisoli]|uniref:uroporphyrinogen-III C-methyltransferase n=1 Tax=Parachryseolinea silvisoli TaxID=2873601 RepID=UPI002265A55A|nr:uroporphyrinogen-III C-methyltransferase [Parachryseolinea silvisoli]MCD9015777.1 uroporphyrinogen-III C-methyltransferase [Parachryseolinea silvisoli]